MAVKFDRAKECSGGAQRGLVNLRDFVTKKWGVGNYGIYNCRPLRGGTALSRHAEGRALDIAVDAFNDKHTGDVIFDWLYAHREVLQLQAIYWNKRRYDTDKYGDGVASTPNDSLHNDHIHVEMNWIGAVRPESIETLIGEGFLMALSETKQLELARNADGANRKADAALTQAREAHKYAKYAFQNVEALIEALGKSDEVHDILSGK